MGFSSEILHADRRFEIEHGSVHKPIHTSVAYTYNDSRELARVFQGKQAGYSYGRQVNPTVDALQKKISLMEDGLASIGFATGMSAIGTTIFSLLRAGDHIVTSQFLFGNTNSLFQSFAEHGIKVSFVDATDVTNVEAALTAETKLVFTETIANPRTQISDLYRIGELCRQRQLLYVVDNTLTSPYLFKAKLAGASLVINSLTKYIGGHANALGGSVTETGLFEWQAFENIYDSYRVGEPGLWGLNQIKKKGLRDFGATLSAEAAHHLSIGSDTLALRMDRACDNAGKLAVFFEDHARVKKVHYPGLTDHPDYIRSREWFRYPGAILSIELEDDLDCFDFLNSLDLVICSSNLGDTRTLAIPVAHSIFHEAGADKRADMGIADSLVRFSVGIEESEDLLMDFEQALA